MSDDADTFRVLFDHHPEPMWIYDIQTLRFLAVNDAAIQQYGYTRDEFLAMEITQIRPAEERARLAANLARQRPVLEQSGVWLHRRRDGQVIDAEITSHSLTYVGRSAVLVIARDVSERRRAEAHREALLAEAEAARAALERRTRQLDAIFDSMADPVWLCGPDGHIERMNHAARTILGVSAEPATARPGGEDVLARIELRDEHGRDLPLGARPVMRVLKGETLTGARAVDVQVGPRTNPVLLSVTGAPIRDEAGQVTGAIMVARDVSERRRMEERVQATLRELNERMEAFMVLAGHEMRTPLTSILGNVQLAADWFEELRHATGEQSARRVEDLRVVLRRMERQGRLLNRLVNDLLDVSRIQAGQLALHPQAFDLLDLVRDVVDEHRQALPGRRFELETPCPRASCRVHADPERVGQVLANFVSNAHKFSPQSEPITVGVQREQSAVRTSVTDRGVGLPATEHERVWQRFYRVDGVGHLTGSSVGLGLGLFLSRVIIERHGGRVGVHSQPGRGATFWFTLPAA